MTHRPSGLARSALVVATAPDALRLRMAIRPKRFTVTGRRRGTAIDWRASRAARVRLAVQRRVRGRGYVRVGTLQRWVRDGTGRTPFAGRVGGRLLRPGDYRLTPTTSGGRVVATPTHVPFTVTHR